MAIRIPPKTDQDAKDSTAALKTGSAPPASAVTVAADATNGITAGSAQATFSALAARIKALETP